MKKEEERVVSRALLSASLAEYPYKRTMRERLRICESFQAVASPALNGLRRVVLLITGAPRYARGRRPFPFLALAPHVSERSSPESRIARVLAPAACGRTPPRPKAV